MGWLGAPGPLSAFQFFSPDAHAVMTMRVQRPALVLGEVVGWISQDNGGHGLPTDSPEFQLVERVAASLGNEVAIGLDNPVLPLPNVKVAIEVLDPVGFHDGMIDLLDLLWSNGSETNQVTVASNAYRNHLIVEFLHPSMPISIAYAVVGDFIVLGPGRPFLESTIDIFADKVGLDQEASFQNALPAKSGSYCSAIFYAGNGEGTSSLAPYLSEYLRSRNIPVDLSTVGVAGGTGHGGVYYAIANNGRIDFFIEGVKGDYEMGGMIPAVAQWIVQPR